MSDISKEEKINDILLDQDTMNELKQEEDSNKNNSNEEENEKYASERYKIELRNLPKNFAFGVGLHFI
jgi:hypothetical protein